MAKILFDIAVAHDPAEWLHSNLVMEISRHIFSYALMNQDKKLLQLRFYELDAPNDNKLVQELSGIISTDEILITTTAKKTVIYNFPESQLVPEKYFHIDTGKDLIALFHGDQDNGITLCEKIKDSEQYNVYGVPAEIHSLLQQHFNNSRYWHYYSLWAMLAPEKTAGAASYLSILFYPKRILVSAVKDTQLHLLQSYAYEAAEDVAYYLLNVCQQLQLSPESTTVILSGMIDVSSAMYSEMYKYFGQLSLENVSAAASVPLMEEYPGHFFSPLLKLAACVS